MKLDHISFAVKSTDDAIKIFKIIYPKMIIYKQLEESQNVLITYLSSENEDYKIELVEPAKKPNPVDNLLKSRDSALYHICYQVEDFKESISYLKKAGFFMITKPFQTAVDKNMWACHFFNPKFGVIEIIGENKNE